ncbi:HipA family kinase [Pseudomonas nunensis]|uniref:HipA family kinase n=1 Tax=Pseudomonas nunensis TaxID=2961896 RepID=UPI0025B1CFB8|nr:HipA family kinase [Pseudomonas nunensis]MDN3223497.1 hypothetical protein [Pseudomonas nunensis]
MFKRLYAVRFDRPASVGRNKACMIECTDMADERTDVIVKFTGCETGATGLIRESLAAFLAADLGLPIPEPILVEVPEGFSAGPDHPDVNTLIRNSSRLAFGSTALPSGYTIYAPSQPLRGPIVQRAVHIFVFDTLIANTDRAPRNPNCMVKGENAIIIDHDLAFILDALFWKEPWKLGGGDELAAPEKHIFWTLAKSHRFDFDDLKSRLKEISDDRLAEYISALPGDWSEGNNSALRIVEYIKNLRDNADSAFSEIQRVLQ